MKRLIYYRILENMKADLYKLKLIQLFSFQLCNYHERNQKNDWELNFFYRTNVKSFSQILATIRKKKIVGRRFEDARNIGNSSVQFR